MDGPALVELTLDRIPPMIERLLNAAQLAPGDVNHYLMHQATELMLGRLRQRLGVDSQKLPLAMQNCGNTVSSTLPIVIHDLRASGRLQAGHRSLLVGYGVGFSWAGCLWTETWDARQSQR